MQVDAKMDSGAVSAVEYVPILDEEDAASLRENWDAVVLILSAVLKVSARVNCFLSPKSKSMRPIAEN